MTQPAPIPVDVTTHRLPFGKYAGVPLADIPMGYLEWALGTVKLSSSLRYAVTGELRRRGIDAPQPPPRDPAPCGRCGGTEITTSAQTFSNGTRHVRASCALCGAFVRFVPQPQRAQP